MDNSRESKLRQQIDAYIKGQLGEKEIQELWNEFAKNPELLDILELEVNVKTIIEENALNKEVDSTLGRLPKWTWHAAAAAAILIVALLQLFRVDTPTEYKDFVVQKINPAQIETAEAVRDIDDQLTTADSLLNLGFEAIVSGDEERALEIFDEVINEYDEEPYGSKAFLNKGILLYNESEYDQAIDAFREAISRVEDSRMITEKAYWYLGNALINIGELEEAQSAVFNAYQIYGIFRAPAFRVLKKLRNDLGSSDYEEFETPGLQ